MPPTLFSPASGMGITVTLVRHCSWPWFSMQPYLYHGEYSPFRDRKHGARAEGLAGDRFVVFLQNHDQVGNRASGDRLNTLMKSSGKTAARCQLPVVVSLFAALFMGEEYGEENPFPFFCSFRGEELVKTVREGRRREYSAARPARPRFPTPARRRPSPPRA